jgi:uncharacterized protein
MDSARELSKTGLILRVGVFAFLEVAGLYLFAPLLVPLAGYFAGAVMSTFAAAAVTNTIALRVWERGQLSDIGLGWNPAARTNLLLGLAAGAGAAALALVPPLLVRAAHFEANPNVPFDWTTLLFVSMVLLFGAVGEEMLFRGYGFQILVGSLGPYATILPISVVFGMAHAGNTSATALSIVNTVAWGVILGVAFLRSGDLWLPVGIHFGWNWTLPLFGVNLSGFTMGATGYVMRWTAGPLWSGGDYGPEGGVLTTIVLVPLIWFLMKGPIRHQKAWLLRDDEETE